MNKSTYGQERINFQKSEIENKFLSYLSIIYIQNLIRLLN